MKYLKSIMFLALAISLPGRVVAQFENIIGVFAGDTAFIHASISVSIRDASTGRMVSSINENLALGSASVMKLVTTASALEILGPQFSFETRIGYTGRIDQEGTLDGNIVIRGGGDPALGSERFTGHYGDFIGEWTDAIISAGIRRVKGRVISDASLFNYSPANGGWSWADLGNYYGAGAHGLSLFENMYRIHFRTGAAETIPEILSVVPEIPGLVIENMLISSGDSDNGYVYVEPYGEYAVIRGSIPVNRDDFVLKASIPDPPLLAATILEKRLNERNIEVDYPATTLRVFDLTGDTRDDISAVVLGSTTSPGLSEIIKVTNVESINLFAEHLLRMISLEANPSGNANVSEGIEKIYELLDEKDIGHDGLYMSDGSGLSRYNAISSSFITSLLCYMKNESKYGGYFVNSLPVAGEEGTLKYYFKDPVFAGRLLAKSGTSTRIRNYAGYIKTMEGKEYTFAILVNNFDCTASEVTTRVETLLKGIIIAK